LAVADVGEQAVVFVSVPGVVGYECVTEEKPLLVFVYVCDRTTKEG